MTTPVEVVAPAPVKGDPYSVENITNPYPLIQRIREAGPVCWLEDIGVFAVGGYEEVWEILTDFETFSSAGGLGPKDIRKQAAWRPPSILESDPPTHTVMRRALAGVINPNVSRQLRARITEPADSLVDRVLAQGEIEVISELAEPFPLKVIPDLLGVRHEGREALLPYGNIVFNAFGPENAILTRAAARADELSRLILESCTYESLDPDGLGVRIWDRVHEGLITDEQAQLLMRALLSAGVDSTVLAIGNLLAVLAERPEAWARLRREPHLAKFAIDESLRFESPFQKFHRTVSADTVLGGVRLPKDAKVLLFLGAANRDPRKWGDDADTFDLDRNASGHVGFGMGLHQCIGQPIARVEIETLLQSLLERVESIEPTAEFEPLVHNSLRGYARIPVRLIPA